MLRTPKQRRDYIETIATILFVVILTTLLQHWLIKPAHANGFTTYHHYQDDALVWNLYTHDLNEHRVQEWLRGLGYISYELTIRGDRGHLFTYNKCLVYTNGICRETGIPANLNPATVVGLSLISQERKVIWLGHRESPFVGTWSVDPRFVEAINNVSLNTNFTGYYIRRANDTVYNPMDKLDNKPVVHAPIYTGNPAKPTKQATVATVAEPTSKCTCQQPTKTGSITNIDPLSKKPYVVDFEIPVVSENRYY